MPNRMMLAITAAVLLAGASLVVAEETNPPATDSAIKVLPDKAPDCTSLKTIVESVTRGCQTNDERPSPSTTSCG